MTSSTVVSPGINCLIDSTNLVSASEFPNAKMGPSQDEANFGDVGQSERESWRLLLRITCADSFPQTPFLK